MKGPWPHMTRADGWVVLILVLIGLVGLCWVFAAPRGSRLVVTDGQKLLYVGPLDRPAEVELRGPLGASRLVVDARGARITQAPCPLKICMSMGPARRRGDLIACVPNRILVQVEGGRPDERPYDLLSR